ncbi:MULTISPECIES: helix-turn-helix domain-containing protein [Bacteroidota]|uniref:Helix-turn-helix domain-containing protein n=1 Tax=Empedobacter falsenii TaxID=343874 RepID=A0A7H9DQX0_9FLAO|nr:MULTISPECIES: helix-turn-helix transcriptional regulator [Bacteroidota]OJZ02530.1 MAG: transcriptional regulator [Sphingobacterium sp. 40-24]QLL57572.1 helix-turn-helix domain-containing protein [Empedobacter falsenii]|tara:strand:- start:274 stop:570 length:297 start_codon:yes stop_codon:yes gene_type:complete
MAFGKHIKELREDKGLFLREVGAALELDSAFISKVENEERPLPRKHIERLAEFYKIPINELLILWLSDKIIELLKNEPVSKQVLKISQKRLKKEENKK